MTASYPCPCCGFLTFAEPSGSYDVCAVCGWEDDNVQLRYPGLAGGANGRSLCDEQRAGGWAALDRDLMRGYRRAPGWRPLRPDECGDLDRHADALHATEPDYYWQRSRPAI